ncbi:MAG: glutamate-cysteine ligase family protein [Thermoguttaceae bacterium]|jgi:gamma-glutamylcysteine synthetase|nr:glutamate-cysteine ligase family protein [Thermoguttaceae bacterium]
MFQRIRDHFLDQFHRALAGRPDDGRRIGAELKFPLVNLDGSAAGRGTVDALWSYLAGRGWQPVTDAVTGRVVGCTRPGEQNDHVAGCETGYCKIEFSLAHVADLNVLEHEVTSLRRELAPFAESHQVRFLGYGIHPVTPPGKDLVLKKVRASVWDKAVPSNRCIAKEDGDDVHLFTVNAGSHVHLGVNIAEAVRAVNVLCGFAGAQIALAAHSNVWRGALDSQYKAVSEVLWDWWEPARGRSGLPLEPFESLDHYADCIAQMRPIYVKRDGMPVVLTGYDTFAKYYALAAAEGLDLDGGPVEIVPAPEDLDLHNSCYWYTARISRYFTVENRVFDQQPPEALLAPAAVSLGLVTVLDEAEEQLRQYQWDALRAARESACRDGLAGSVDGRPLADAARDMLAAARDGLKRRKLGEERFLEPFEERLKARRCPADDVANLFTAGGMEALIDARSI